MTDYRPAPEVEDIARDLIRDVEQHKSLDAVRIDYVYRDKAAVRQGKTMLATARKITGLVAFLCNPEFVQRDLFVIEVAEDAWDDLTPEQQRALTDHALSRCRVEMDDQGTPQLSLCAPDIEEFAGVLERHGIAVDRLALVSS